MFRHFTGKLNLNCFQALGFSRCSIYFPVTCPCHPAISLHMSSILNASIIFRLIQLNPNPLQALGFSGRSAHITITNPILPAISLHMSLILYCRLFRNNLFFFRLTLTARSLLEAFFLFRRIFYCFPVTEIMSGCFKEYTILSSILLSIISNCCNINSLTSLRTSRFNTVCCILFKSRFQIFVSFSTKFT